MKDEIVGYIYKTLDYEKLHVTKENRNLVSSNLKKIEKSIQEMDLGVDFPVVVDSEYRVIDGQHRASVRAKLGIPVYYVVSAKKYSLREIILLNKNASSWKIKDYLQQLANLGDQNSIKALCDANTYKVDINIFLASVDISVSSDLLADGKFRYTDEHSQAAEELFKELSIFEKYKFWNQLRFIKAYKKVRLLNNFKYKRMVEAITRHGEQLVAQRSRSNYLFKLIEVYNYNLPKGPGGGRIPYPAQNIFEDWGDA